MAIYNYRAKSRTGAVVTGTVDADSESRAAALVREMGHLPMEIKPLTQRRPSSTEAGSVLVRHLVYPLWTGVNLRQLVFFYRQLATLLGSGMSLSEGLRSVGGRTGGRLGRLIDEIDAHVQRGGRMSEVIERHPRVFSRLQLSLIRVGEAGGLLEQMIDRIASYLEYELSVRRMIGKMLVYPVLVLFFAFAAYVGIPHITLIVEKGLGDFLAAVWPAVRVTLIWVITAVVALKLLFQFDSVKLVWDSIKVQPPIIGSTARKIAMSRFSRALALLYSAGMPIGESVFVAAEASGNLYIAAGIKHAVPAIQSGHGLTESLAKTGAVTSIVLDMLSTGEKTGSTDAVLQKVADYMDDEADATIHKLGMALFVFMILVAAVVVGSIVINFYMNMAANVLRQGG